MADITALFVAKVAAQLDPEVERAPLLRMLDLVEPIDPSLRVGAGAYYDFLERVAALDARATTLPLRVGASMRCDEYGALGLAWKSAPDLRGSLLRAVRYGRVLTSVSTYAFEKAPEGAYFHLHRHGERRLGLRLSNEASLASIVSMCREAAAGDFDPLGVSFKHPAPETTAEHEEFFGCPVHFGSDRDALWVSAQTLGAPNSLSDASFAKFFDTHLEAEIARLGKDESLEERIRMYIARSLSEGPPTLKDVAKHLGMSGRTLQRRLSGRDLAFQKLIDDTRRQLARRLLEEKEYSLAEVAFMTGFAEQSSFTRAFKRWAGQTPRSYRLEASTLRR